MRGAKPLAGRLLERLRGIRTSDPVALSELGLSHPERVDYEPSGWLSLRLALPRREVGAEDVFADIGCGAGRVVYQAARRYPFNRVIGVELSPELGELARQNVEAHRQRLRCSNVEIVTAEALDWPVPDDLTLAYMFSPFTGETFGRMIERLIASYDRAPRRLRIVYLNPEEHDHLMATGRVRELPLRRSLLAWLLRYPDGWTRLYEIVPGAEASTARGAAIRESASP